MGKKKDERKRREREAEMAAAGEQSCGGHAQAEARHGDEKPHGKTHAGKKHEAGTAFAGIAAGIARQMGTPVGRQMIAAGLMAAATAISKHDAKPSVRPTPPTPPAPPVPPSARPEPTTSKVEPDVGTEAAKPSSTGPFAGDTAEPPRSETNALPPEFAKVIDSVTVGLERLFVGFGRPKDTPPTK